MITMPRVRTRVPIARESGAQEANEPNGPVRARLARRVAEKEARKLEQQSEKQVGV